MNYYFKRILKNKSFDEVVEAVQNALKAEGFGIVTQLDMQATIKNKLNKDIQKYLIMGACNPPFAYRSLQAEGAIGTLLPCNVVVREVSSGQVEVDMIDPQTAMQAVENEEMKVIANEIHDKLEKAINNL